MNKLQQYKKMVKFDNIPGKKTPTILRENVRDYKLISVTQLANVTK